MKAFALFHHPERDTEYLLGLYSSEEGLKHDIDILESIDKLRRELYNKAIFPSNEDMSIFHYSWREMEIANPIKKGE